jgi:hypothetical protein
VICSKCGTPIDPKNAVYSVQTAALVCASCQAAETINTGFTRAAASVSLGALAAGVMANSYFCCIPAFVTIIFGIVGLIGGIRAITLINRPEYRSELGSKYGWYLTAAIAGIVLASVGSLVSVLALTGMVFGRH